MSATSISIPTLVRIKPGALGRLGVYCARNGFRQVTVIGSADLIQPLSEALEGALAASGIETVLRIHVQEGSFEEARRILTGLPAEAAAVIGFGGGRALDVAKFVASLARRPYLAVPTSLSNDGFASSGTSLLLEGKKRSLNAVMPFGVVIDTEVCLRAPLPLWHSGVGDLSAKLTAVRDWKLAFHAVGEPVNDFAALLSDASVRQFISRPVHDLDGTQLLATALMLNGVAMEVCGSSRPASGSEHLISHALDRLADRPGLHGIQVGVASYIVSHLQRGETETIGQLFDSVGFWQTVRQRPLEIDRWLAAIRLAPEIKPGYYTVLSERDCLSEAEEFIRQDPRLQGCFS